MDINMLGEKIDMYENGDMSVKDAVDFFCLLMNYRILPSLQGSYMRQFEEFRASNLITFDFDSKEWVTAPEADEIW